MNKSIFTLCPTHSPIGYGIGEVGHLILVHVFLVDAYKSVLFAVGPYRCGAGDGGTEMAVDGGAEDRIDSFHLTRRVDVKSLPKIENEAMKSAR